MKNTNRMLIVAATLVAGAGLAHADLIASQDFNALDDSQSANTDSFSSGTLGQILTNGGSMNTAGPGVDFHTDWSDTAPLPNQGPFNPADESTGDFIGVSSFSGTNAPDVAPDGTPYASGAEHHYRLNDGDGQLTFISEFVDTSGFTGRTVSVDYWIADAGYESNDRMDIAVWDGAMFAGGITLLQADLEAAASADAGNAGEWINISFMIPDGLGPNLQFFFSTDLDADDENIYMDNLEFRGVPAPGAVALLAMTGLAGRRWRG